MKLRAETIANQVVAGLIVVVLTALAVYVWKSVASMPDAIGWYVACVFLGALVFAVLNVREGRRKAQEKIDGLSGRLKTLEDWLRGYHYVAFRNWLNDPAQNDEKWAAEQNLDGYIEAERRFNAQIGKPQNAKT